MATKKLLGTKPENKKKYSSFKALIEKGSKSFRNLKNVLGLKFKN